MQEKLSSYNAILIGAAGYVAPKHMRAIKATGGNLVAALDPHDSVGVIDSYFPDCKFFTEFERFDRYCNKQIDSGIKIDYVSICSPNAYHVDQCLWALHHDINAICEKPLCFGEDEARELIQAEKTTGKKIWNIAQLRLSEAVLKLKSLDLFAIEQAELKYFTPRGDWYNKSWKGNPAISGGLASAIGIHLFDILLFLFGTEYEIVKWANQPEICFGTIKFNNCMIDIELNIGTQNKVNRSLSFGGKTFELSKNFTDLHCVSYENIIKGAGISIDDVKPAIILCEKLRNL